MTIRAIETRYAGCRFRSRLEARWAVFFDHLDIAWEYEPQGYEVTHRITQTEGTFRYLPDFWLPDLGVWAEIKGELDTTETTRLLDAAASLSSNNGGGCHDHGGNNLAVFGSLTASTDIGMPVLLHLHKGDLEASCLWCGPHTRSVKVADDSPWRRPDAGATILRGWYCRTHSADRHIAAARDAARTTRFEFGSARR